MSKFSARKGLGLGAVVALATTLFAGAPAAQASVAPVTLAGNDSYGTYTVIYGTQFVLKSWVTPAADNEGPLHYQVKNVGTNTVFYNWQRGYGTDFPYTENGSNHSGEVHDHWVLDAGEKDDFHGQSGDYVRTDLQNDLGLALVSQASQVSSKLQVTAYIDTNGNEQLDPNEDSAVQTITWVDGRSSVATTTIDDTYEHASSLDAHVTFANKDINLEQVANSIYSEAEYSAEGCSTLAVTWVHNQGEDSHFTGNDCDGTNNSEDVFYDSDTKSIDFPWYENGSNVEKGVYTAQAWYWNEGDIWANDAVKIGTVAQKSVAANVVDHVGDVKLATGANVVTYGTREYEVRSGTTSLTYTATVYKADSDGKTNNNPVGAGIAASFTLEDQGLNYGSTIVAGGKTLIPNGDNIVIPATTDANGQISVTITATAKQWDEFYIWADARQAESSDTWTQWEDTSWVIYANPSGDRWISVGGSTTVNYTVADQFNQPYTGSDFQVRVSRSTEVSRSGANADFGYVAPVSNGAASVTIKDNGTGIGEDEIIATLQKKSTGDDVATEEHNDNYTWNGTGYSYYFYLDYTDAALVTPTAVSVVLNNDGNSTDYKPIALSDLSKFVPYNDFQEYSNDGFNYPDNAYTSPSAGSPSETVWVDGYVTGAAGVVGGVPVTISLPGAIIDAYAYADVYNSEFSAKDSITVLADSDGYYGAYLYSDVPGKQTVTVTSGSVSKTATLTFAQSTPKSVALAVNGGSATAQAGRTVPVAATVKDAGGHGVSGVTVTFTSAGSGSLSATTATTNASGVATVNYVTGASDVGSVDFTATAPSGSDTLTSSKVTVSFVHSSGNVTHKGAVATANWSNAKGQSILVTVDGYRRYNQVELADGANFFSKKLKKGRHTVNLYVGGVLVDSLKFTVKK